jgi:hypothetical protein
MNRRHDPQYPNIFRKSPRLRSKKSGPQLMEPLRTEGSSRRSIGWAYLPSLTRYVNFWIGPWGNVYQRTAEDKPG